MNGKKYAEQFNSSFNIAEEKFTKRLVKMLKWEKKRRRKRKNRKKEKNNELLSCGITSTV